MQYSRLYICIPFYLINMIDIQNSLKFSIFNNIMAIPINKPIFVAYYNRGAYPSKAD